MNIQRHLYVGLWLVSVVVLSALPANSADWPMLGRDATRNSVSPEGNPPLNWAVPTYDWKTERWNEDKARNVRWKAKLGTMTYGSPIVADGKVFIGTNSARRDKPYSSHEVMAGALLCFRESDGEFLWQFPARELATTYYRMFPSGLGTSPLVEGKRLWFVSNRCEMICLDTEGFHDRKDDGVKDDWAWLFNTSETYVKVLDSYPRHDRVTESLEALKKGVLTDWLRKAFGQVDVQLPANAEVASVEADRKWMITAKVGDSLRRFYLCLEGKELAAYKVITPADKQEADVVWRFDMVKELGVYQQSLLLGPHRHGSPASYQNRIYVVTGNGTDRTGRIQAPKAPSLVCFDKETGKVLWTDASPGDNILHGTVADPLVIEVDGRGQVIVGQADGWLRSFDALTGELIWKFDINKKESKWGYGGDRSTILAAPVFYRGRVYLGSGRDSENCHGQGRLVCIDPKRKGDISSELAVDAEGRVIPHRRLQAVLSGEKAIPNPNSGVIWEYTAVDQNGNGKLDFEEVFHRTISSVTIKNNLLIAADHEGVVHCFDTDTGKRHWACEAAYEMVATPLIVGDVVYVASADGKVLISRLSPDPKQSLKRTDDGKWSPLVEIDMTHTVYSSPTFANGVLYIATGSHLWAIAPTKVK